MNHRRDARADGGRERRPCRDDSGQMQIYVDKSRLEAGQPGGFGQLKNLLDIGDIVGAKGSVKRTEKGEISVVASELGVLTKSLLPLPDKWHGLADVEKRYRCGSAAWGLSMCQCSKQAVAVQGLWLGCSSAQNMGVTSV